jgi:serine/threonine protein kinase
VFASGSPSAPPPSAVYNFAQLQPGQLLAQGRYTVQRALSKGGMGAIYLATDHETFDRIVVIKAMLDYFDPLDPRAIQVARDRFIQEARTLATLRHPAIPQIYTYFQEGPHNYIVMEYIEGHDLLQRLTHAHDMTGWPIPGKPYPRESVLGWGVAICRVLEYLASRRPEPVVHHDIKPANLLLDSNSGDIRLVDFGTARARLLAHSGRVGLAQSSIYGTQGYAAPEQYSGHSEPRSDVYALAATLYHLATDDDPRDHAFEFPRLSELGALGQVLRLALDPSANNRPDAREIRSKLEELLAPGAPQPIQTPDGLEVYDQAELVRWCEAHWPRASAWLYGVLPDQVERVWGKTKLAQEIRETTLRHRYERSAGLDATLELLDPQGFGSAQPRISATTQSLDFGVLAPRAPQSQRLELSNEGRRHIDAALVLPGWISASRTTIAIPPGQRTTIELSAHGAHKLARGQLRDHITVRAGTTAQLDIKVQAAISWWNFLRGSTYPWPVALGLIMALVLFWRWTSTPAELSTMPEPQRAQLAPRVSSVSPQPYPTTQIQSYPVPQRSPTPEATPPIAYLAPRPPSVENPDGVVDADAVIHWQHGDTLRLEANLIQPGLFSERETLTERKGQFLSAAANPYGPEFAVGDASGIIQFWRSTHELLWSSDEDNDPINALAFSPDGQILAASGTGGTIKLRQASDGRLLATFKSHHGYVAGIAFSPDGRSLASAGDGDGLLKLWRVGDGKLLWEAIADKRAVHDVAFSPDGSTLASASADGAIQLWQASDGAPLRTLQQQGADARCVDFSPDGRSLAAGSADGVVRLWHVDDTTAYRSIDIQRGTIWSVAFSTDGAYLAIAGKAPTIWIVQAQDGKVLQELNTHRREMRQVLFQGMASLIASGAENTTIFWYGFGVPTPTPIKP